MHSYFILIFLNFFNISARRGEYTKGLMNLFQLFFSVLILNQNLIYFFFFNLWDFHNCFVLFPLFFCSVYVFQIVTCLKYFSWREIIYLNQCVVCLWCVSFPYITMCWKKDWLGGMWLFVYPFIIDFLSGEGGGLIGKHCLVGLLLFNKIFITSFNGHF